MKSKIINKTYLLGIIAATTVFLVPSLAGARVKGVCSDCHTMHNSQDGNSMMFSDFDANGNRITDGSGNTLDSVGPQRALTRGGCVGCHTGTNTDTNNIPYVDDRSAEPSYTSADGTTGNTLAGGSFYWVRAGNDSVGHNVEGIADMDVALGNAPPGFTSVTNGVYSDQLRLTCAGTNGCHGNQVELDSYADLAGAHHGDDVTDVVAVGTSNSYSDGTTLAKSFRFLLGVEGLEDSRWEYQPTSSKHNQYKGEDRTDGSARTVNANGPTTISGLCGNCHGDFHANSSGEISYNTALSNPWMRHPTDFDMARASGTSEYEFYNAAASNGAAGTYSVEAPVASANATLLLASVNVTAGNDTAIVTCISCHRAHGSEHDDLLRWDYKGMIAHAGTDSANNTQNPKNGCFVCHTTKDAI